MAKAGARQFWKVGKMADEDYDINDLKRRMQGALSVFKNDLAGLRTGRASASLASICAIRLQKIYRSA